MGQKNTENDRKLWECFELCPSVCDILTGVQASLVRSILVNTQVKKCRQGSNLSLVQNLNMKEE